MRDRRGSRTICSRVPGPPVREEPEGVSGAPEVVSDESSVAGLMSTPIPPSKTSIQLTTEVQYAAYYLRRYIHI